MKSKQELLFKTRKYLWHPDTIVKLASWFGLKPGMRIADIGCGIGYLGYTYWPFYRRHGRYIGIDIDYKSLKAGEKMAAKWGGNRIPHFIQGDAYHLPLKSNSVDCAMAQTLYIHLNKPKQALREIFRIVRPGGLVVIIEPDTLSRKSVSSLPDLDLKTKLLLEKYRILRYKGREKLGLGDYSIGSKMPYMMKEAGLKDIDVRINDRVSFIEPPYESLEQRYFLEMLTGIIYENDQKQIRDEGSVRKQFIAGGGKANEYDQVVKIGRQRKSILKRQLSKNKLFYLSTSFIYIVKGRKPKLKK